jgi:hypothetical protein
MPIVNLISEKIRHVRRPKSGRNIDVFTALARAGGRLAQVERGKTPDRILRSGFVVQKKRRTGVRLF